MGHDAGKRLKILWAPLFVLLGSGAPLTVRLAAQEAQPSVGLKAPKPSAPDFNNDALSILQQKCYLCHGAAQKSGLDLRTRESALAGGDSGPAIVPGNAGASRLYRRVAGLEEPRMPFAPKPPLMPEEVAVLKSWIDRGATWSPVDSANAVAPKKEENNKQAAGSYANGYKEKTITAEDRKWWAFLRPIRSAVPNVADARWRVNAIDAFIKNALDQKGLAPAHQADRSTLIRRASLDLLGLLPSPAEVDAFVSDSSPQAYQNLIERLLSSPHYGERWGRFWLDVVRYADSSGFEHDNDIANAWRYRDYVIKAFNQDKPYNRFIVEQIAGDELEDRNYDTLTATTYYRIGPRVRYREKDNPYYRYEYLDDIIRTTFQGFMGLSVNCARCHDHKFDPISRLDYYRTMAMLFSNVDYNHPLAPPDKIGAYEKTKKEVEEEIRVLRRKISDLEAPYKKAAFEKRLAKFPQEIQIAVNTPEEKRTPGQKLLAAQIVSLDVDPDAAANPLLAANRKLIAASDAGSAVRQKLLDQMQELQKRLPLPLPVAEGIRDGDYRLTPDGPGDEPLPGKGNRFDYGVQCCFLPQPGRPFQVPPVYFAATGLDVAEDQKSFVVQPGYLQVFVNGTPPPIAHPPSDGNISSGRRRALAEWISSPENPLTARVMVNRIWHWHFGRGIVATPGNFGKMGVPPSHPELLDWLATEFVRQGWSIKQMHRLIMNSETYKMDSSFYRDSNMERDPANVYLWRFPLRRLEAEAIRDVILSASGRINLEAGGEPFFPSISKSLREGYRQGKWVLTHEEPSTWRRSIYAYSKRGLKYPLFEVHDQPDPNVTCERRNVTTVPTQALTLLNNEFVLIQARYFAQRVVHEAGSDIAKQIDVLYRIAVSRKPTRRELEQSQAFIQKQRNYHASRRLGSDSVSDSTADRASLAALTDLAHVMLNASEFVYIN
ncbi:MAG TPA: PSD1 and planctomycete cytochrome C domain-containing protein [Acidobacteriota bacterium]|jgi:hypothetical protein|nr:PSD1 and planctomycete cytochrome C domain-containing protein [Acidobacteriota bacterium]